MLTPPNKGKIHNNTLYMVVIFQSFGVIEPADVLRMSFSRKSAEKR
jgi:hypothetical protein